MSIGITCGNLPFLAPLLGCVGSRRRFRSRGAVTEANHQGGEEGDNNNSNNMNRITTTTTNTNTISITDFIHRLSHHRPRDRHQQRHQQEHQLEEQQQQKDITHGTYARVLSPSAAVVAVVKSDKTLQGQQPRSPHFRFDIDGRLLDDVSPISAASPSPSPSSSSSSSDSDSDSDTDSESEGSEGRRRKRETTRSSANATVGDRTSAGRTSTTGSGIGIGGGGERRSDFGSLEGEYGSSLPSPVSPVTVYGLAIGERP
jgi:hypothetical protein